jgi:hypothetical protein
MQGSERARNAGADASSAAVFRLSLSAGVMGFLKPFSHDRGDRLAFPNREVRRIIRARDKLACSYRHHARARRGRARGSFGGLERS